MGEVEGVEGGTGIVVRGVVGWGEVGRSGEGRSALMYGRVRAKRCFGGQTRT